MNRRELLTRAVMVAATAGMRPNQLLAQDASFLYLNPEKGADSNPGSKERPLRSLAAAARIVNGSMGTGAMTIVLSEGVYAVDQSALFKPSSRTFTNAQPLTIRAEVLPDDSEWAHGRMPVLVHTMALSPNWLGRPDPFEGVNYGMQFETSHVRVQGLKFLGTPHLERTGGRAIHRVYPIAREGADLDGLEVSQCVFVGDPDTIANHCGVLARGHGVVIDHCVFQRCKITAVFWTGDAHGCAMRNTLALGCFVTGAWICAIGDDFEFRNNVMSQNQSAVLFQGAIKNYKLADSLFAANQDVFGAGNGPAVNYRQLPLTALALPPSVAVVDTPVQIERDETKRDYLHIVAGTRGAELGAGLFTKRS